MLDMQILDYSKHLSGRRNKADASLYQENAFPAPFSLYCVVKEFAQFNVKTYLSTKQVI